jgi:hypothetical protein
MKRLNAGLAIALITVCGILVSEVAYAKDKTTRYEVTITNLTRGQILSPPVVISHNSNYHLFTAGNPATPGLAELAEDADTGPLTDYLRTLPSVFDFKVAGGVILPGSSATLKIKTKRGFQLVSAAAMLVTTNDAFMAAQGVYARPWGDVAVDARAYDAGSEVNNEQCAFIPGPPCGNGGVRDTEGAEGYVYIHAGIHGIGDLEPAEFDWRNPVASIMIRRAK